VSVFTLEGVHIIASKKKVEFLKPAENVKDSDCPSVKLITREKVSLVKITTLIYVLTYIILQCLLMEM